jgi:hypothetical protein
MKLFIIVLMMLAFSSTVNAATGPYVTVYHLHQVFKGVKQRSDVSQKALARAFAYYEKYRYIKHLSSQYIAIADYTKTALHRRLYIINLYTGELNHYLVAHGVNSGSKGGRVWHSSNRRGSHQTPYGFFKIGFKEGKTTKKGYDYLSVTGLEWSNRNAGLSPRRGGRDILVHTAGYVARAGRSHGCFAIRPQDKWAVFSKLKGALFYSYTGR